MGKLRTMKPTADARGCQLQQLQQPVRAARPAHLQRASALQGRAIRLAARLHMLRPKGAAAG